MSRDKQRINGSILFIAVLLWMSLSASSADHGRPIALLREPRTAALIKQAWAVIYAPDMRRGSLLMLRGAVGKADVTFRQTADSWCAPVPLRLLLGDFSGDSVAIGQSGPALVIVFNQEIADSMRAGHDITSDTLRVFSLDHALSEPGAGFDIVLAGSASPNDGFVLNMGRNLWSDIFGASAIPGPCVFGGAGAALK